MFFQAEMTVNIILTLTLNGTLRESLTQCPQLAGVVLQYTPVVQHNLIEMCLSVALP